MAYETQEHTHTNTPQYTCIKEKNYTCHIELNIHEPLCIELYQKSVNQFLEEPV